jgi:hypothetical protein
VKIPYHFYLWLFIPFAFGVFNFIFYFSEPKTVSYLLPCFGLLFTVINGLFFFFTYKRDKILAYFFQGTALFVGILILFFLIKTI